MAFIGATTVDLWEWPPCTSPKEYDAGGFNGLSADRKCRPVFCGKVFQDPLTAPWSLAHLSVRVDKAQDSLPRDPEQRATDHNPPASIRETVHTSVGDDDLFHGDPLQVEHAIHGHTIWTNKTALYNFLSNVQRGIAIVTPRSRTQRSWDSTSKQCQGKQARRRFRVPELKSLIGKSSARFSGMGVLPPSADGQST